MGPRGINRILQLLDVTINKPFKNAILKKYTEYCYNKNLSYFKVNDNTIINCISKVWWSENIITSTMWSTALRNTGIDTDLN